MTGDVVWGVSVLSEGVGTLHTGGRCEAIVLFLFLHATFRTRRKLEFNN
jgi:hypothetical protein